MTPDDLFSSLEERTPELRPQVFVRVRSQIQGDAAGMGAPSRARRLVYSGGLGVGAVAALALPHILRGQYSTLVALGIVSLLSVGLVLYPTLPGEGATRVALDASAKRRVLGAAVAAALTFFSFWAEEFRFPGGHELFNTSSSCALHAVGNGAVVLAALLVVWRKSDPFVPRTTAALLGAVAGALGVTATTMRCPIHEGFHLLLGHALVVSILAAIGALVGPKTLAP